MANYFEVFLIILLAISISGSHAVPIKIWGKPVPLSAISPSAALSKSEPFIYRTAVTLANYQHPSNLAGQPNRLAQHRGNTVKYVPDKLPWHNPGEKHINRSPTAQELEKLLDDRHYARLEALVYSGDIIIDPRT